MTKETEIFDYFRDLLAQELTTYQRLSNAYIIEENNDLAKEKGWAVAYGPARNLNTNLTKGNTVARDFAIVLVQQIFTTQHNDTIIEETEKAIMTDRHTIKKIIDGDPQLNPDTVGGSPGCIADYSNFISDDGLEFLIAGEEGQKYYRLTSTFEVGYTET